MDNFFLFFFFVSHIIVRKYNVINFLRTVRLKAPIIWEKVRDSYDLKLEFSLYGLIKLP